MKLGFIGCGNMATNLIKGLLRNHDCNQQIFISGRDHQKLQDRAKLLGVRACQSNIELLEKSDVILLCVKPHQIRAICNELKNKIRPKQLWVSVAAGISCSQLQQWLGPQAAIVRMMPNTPCAIGAGVIALFADTSTTDEQQSRLRAIFSRLGLVVTSTDEKSLDVITAFSGSGPAYLFLFIEALQQAAVSAGIEQEQASLIAKQLMLGAAQMAKTSEKDLIELRKEVTSPGGSTEQAIKVFEEKGFRKIVALALNKAYDRVREMSTIQKTQPLGDPQHE